MLGAPIYHHWTIFGHIGVIYFFVLSGFIIFHAHAKDIGYPEQGISYFKKRIIRIYPIYWAVLLIILIKVAFFGNSQTVLPCGLYSWGASILLLPQQLDNNPGSNIGGVFAPIDGVAWSLEYEVIFYAFFLILILHRNLGIFLGVLSFVIYLLETHDLLFPLSLLKQPYLLIFGFGVAAAWISRSDIPKNHAAIYGLLGFLIIALMSLYEVIGLQRYSEQLSVVLSGGGFFLIILCLVAFEKQGRVIGKQPFLQLIGAASYSIYLVHAPLVHICVKTLSKFQIASLFIPFLFAVLTVFAILAGVAVHKMIEQPLISHGRRFLKLKRA